MPILFQYLLRFFLVGFLKTVGIFIGLFLLIDGLESIRRFSQKPNFNAADVTILILCRIPDYLAMLTPSMVLLTILMVISRLTRQHEMMIIQASGVSLMRLLLPFLVGGVAIAGVHAVFQEQILPHTNRIAQKMRNNLIDNPVSIVTQTGDLWLRHNQMVIHANRIDPISETLHGVTIFTFDLEHRLAARQEAKLAVHQNDCWQLLDGIDYQFLPMPTIMAFKRQIWNVTLDLENLIQKPPLPDSLTLGELHAIASKMERDGHDSTQYRVFFHRKLAAPAIILAAILLAFPFALSLPRSGGVMRSFLIGLLLGFAMFILQDLATALGLGGRLPPILAAWAPVLFFGSIAGYLLLHYASPRRKG